MNCCDYHGNCNQGPNCPVRTAQASAAPLQDQPDAPAHPNSFEQIAYWACVLAASALSVFFVAGGSGYAFVRWLG